MHFENRSNKKFVDRLFDRQYNVIILLKGLRDYHHFVSNAVGIFCGYRLDEKDGVRFEQEDLIQPASVRAFAEWSPILKKNKAKGATVV